MTSHKGRLMNVCYGGRLAPCIAQCLQYKFTNSRLIISFFLNTWTSSTSGNERPFSSNKTSGLSPYVCNWPGGTEGKQQHGCSPCIRSLSPHSGNNRKRWRVGHGCQGVRRFICAFEGGNKCHKNTSESQVFGRKSDRRRTSDDG